MTKVEISDLLSKVESGQDVTISVTLTSKKHIQKLNKDYLKRDFPTDVLSFSIHSKDEEGSYLLGDIVVSVEAAREQAGEYNNTLEEELAELVGHGVLHLLEVHHPDDDSESIHGINPQNA